MAAVVAPQIEELPIHAQWASFAIRDYLARVQTEIKALPGTADIDHLFPIANNLYTGEDTVKKFKVGIIGAGCAGLFTAMIFDLLKKNFGLDVEYDILEANDESRLGGRLYTYKFPNSSDNEYYDVGAMRFPKIAVMKRTFELFDVLEMKEPTDPKKPEKGNLIPYYLLGKNIPYLYNDTKVVLKDPSSEKLTSNTFGIELPGDMGNKSPGSLVEDSIDSFVKVYKKDGAEAFWKDLMARGDRYSVRQWLMEKTSAENKYDFRTTEVLETLDYGNRWYDQALSELVLETINFDPSVPWKCVQGGAQEIARRMSHKLEQQNRIEYCKRVVAISRDADGPSKEDPSDDPQNIVVKIHNEDKPRYYHAVFNSAPLGAMQQMQLEGLNLHYNVKMAIRSLGYGNSCKIGIRFKKLWWIEKGINEGGVGKTDLPIRCCVYPSYNINDYKEGEDTTGVLLVSYTWSQEADRIGALIHRESPQGEEELKQILFHDLARLHAPSPAEYDEYYKLISENYMDHYAHDWSSSSTSVSAFAYFGPGQFQNLYPHIVKSDGKHIIIGEAASAHHAWVVGSLESAVTGVYNFLIAHSPHSKAATEAANAYKNGKDDRLPGPFGPLPAEYTRTDEVKTLGIGDKPAEVKASPIGEFARQLVVLEKLRIEQGGDKLNTGAVKAAEQVEMFRIAAPPA